MLAVDIGNTNIRIAGFIGGAIRARRSLPTRGIDLNDLVRAFTDVKERVGAECAWIASVAPGINAYAAAAAERTGLRKRFIRPGTDFIIPHALEAPWNTGVDRLVAAYAAGVKHFPRAAGGKGYVVVQCGSAATVDWVDQDGIFRGGYILPGPTFWLLGLSVGAQLPNLADETADWSSVKAGDNTHDAIMNGMQLALPMTVASAALMVAGGEPAGGIVVTGGWGEAPLPYMQGKPVVDPDLVLHGIRMFSEVNEEEE